MEGRPEATVAAVAGLEEVAEEVLGGRMAASVVRALEAATVGMGGNRRS